MQGFENSGCPPARDTVHTSRVRIGESILILLLSAVITAGAFWIFPVWVDDSVFSEMVRKNANLFELHRDRPLIGLVWETWRAAGILIPAAVVTHWLAWSTLALSAMAIWRRLFPEAARFSISVGCLVLGPAICQAQWVAVNFPMGGVIGPAFSYVALALLLADSFQSRSSKWRITAAFAFVFVGAQFSEYAVPPTIFGAVLIALRPFLLGQAQPSIRKREVAVAIALLGVAALSYLVYHHFADANVRLRVRPETTIVASGIWSLKVLIPRTISQIWLVSIGGVLAAMGRLRLDSYETLAAVFVGLITSLAVWRMSRAARTWDPAIGTPTHMTRRYVLICLALFPSLLPMGIMGAVAEDRISSRFLLPVLPAAACASTATLLLVLRPRRTWIIAVIAGFLLGYGQAIEIASAQVDGRKLRAWSEPIRDHLAPDGITVAVFAAPWNNSELLERQFALTTRLTEDWPAEERRRFWALGSVNETNTDNGTIDLFSSHPSVDFWIRGVGRRGPVTRILWLYPSGNQLNIEQTSCPSSVPIDTPQSKSRE